MKNLKIKKLLALAIAGVLSVGLVACGSSDADGAKTDAAAGSDSASGTYRTLEDIKKDGTINIGVFSDKNPFGYVDENGEYQGYDVYFANRLAKDLGVKVNFVSTEAANRIEYLQTGKVDVILANFTVTEERAQEVDFALPYMNAVMIPLPQPLPRETRNYLTGLTAKLKHWVRKTFSIRIMKKHWLIRMEQNMKTVLL